MNSDERREKTRRRIKELGLDTRRKFIHITCIKCGKERDIRVNDKSIYNEEMLKNYICVFCK